MNSAQEAQEALEKAKQRVRDDYGAMGVEDSSELASKIEASFQAAFDRPPVEEFEMVLQRNFSPDEVRVCLFNPREEQIKFYTPLMVAANAPEIDRLEKDHQLKKLKPLMLSLVFLLHRHNWKWMEEFIVRGGLDILATMIAEPNLYYRGQVVEIFITATDCDTFDWFQRRTDVLGRTLHIRLLELADHPSFLSNVLANREKTFPGGSMRCLTILAFWLSWVRAVYTENQVLQLSTQIVTELQLWARTGLAPGEEDEKDEEGTKKEDGGDKLGQDKTDERNERKLVRTLLRDFTVDQYKDKETAKKGERDLGEGVGVTGFTKPKGDEQVMKRVQEVFGAIDDDRILAFKSKNQVDGGVDGGTGVMSPAPPSAQGQGQGQGQEIDVASLKGTGNRLFGNGDYLGAMLYYDQAVQKAEAKAIGERDEALLAALYFNRAACHWKVAVRKNPALVSSSSSSSSSKEEDDAETEAYMKHALNAGLSGDETGKAELASCEAECRKCLALSSSHHKAAYRLAAVLLALGRPQEAGTMVAHALDALSVAAASARSDSSTSGLESTYASLKALRTRCMAATMVEGRKTSSRAGEGGSGNAGGGASLSGPAAKMLAALQKRKDREKKKEVHAEGSSDWKIPTEEDRAPRGEKTTDKGGDDAAVSEYFGAGNVYTGEGSRPSSSKGAMKDKGKEKDKKGDKNDDKEKDMERKMAKAEAKKALKARLQTAVTALRGAARSIERADYTHEAVEKHGEAVIVALEAVLAAKGGSRKGYSLATGFKDAALVLDEPIVCASLLALYAASCPNLPLLKGLVECDRFGSVLSMALFGNDVLKAAVTGLCSKCDGQEGMEATKARLQEI